MRKYLALLGSVMLSVSCACSIPVSAEQQTESAQDETEQAVSDVLLDDQYAKITYEDVIDEGYCVGYKVLFENKTSDQYLLLSSDNTSVNGMMQYMDIQNSTVAPGMKTEAELRFYTDSDGAVKSKDDLVNVKGVFRLSSNTDGGSTYTELEHGMEFTIPVSVKEGSGSGEKQDVPAAAVLLDDSYASITYDGTIEDSYYVGFKVIFENKTSDQYLLLSADNTSVDGMMQYMDIQNSTAAPGMKAESELRFYTDNSSIGSLDDLKNVKGTFRLSSNTDGGSTYSELESGMQFTIPSEEELAASPAQDTGSTEGEGSGAASAAAGAETDSVKEAEEKETEPVYQEVKAGETISCPDYEVTVNSVGFSYDVYPDDTSGYYTYYSAESGEVYVDVDYTLKDLLKSSIAIRDLPDVNAVYSDGYQYSSMPYVSNGSTFLTAPSWAVAEPLTTCHVHALIACPDEVEESAEPLYVYITMSDGTQYRYTVRGDQSESADSTNGSGSSFSEIRRGDSGDTVKKIQEKLIELGVLSGSADGQFGPGTESAIAAFQKNNNLEASGVVNEETYNALFSDE
jgi:hypothetical protein